MNIVFTTVSSDQVETVTRLAWEIWPAVYSTMISREQIDYMLAWMYAPDKIREEIREQGIVYLLIQKEAEVGSCRDVVQGTVRDRTLYDPRLYPVRFLIDAAATIGFTAFGPFKAGEIGFIHKIYVSPEHHRQGIGCLTLAEIENRAVLSGVSGLELRVNRANHRAIALYQKVGFRMIAEECAAIGGGFVMDDFSFRKLL